MAQSKRNWPLWIASVATLINLFATANGQITYIHGGNRAFHFEIVTAVLSLAATLWALVFCRRNVIFLMVIIIGIMIALAGFSDAFVRYSR
jgi:hypothetical protein